MALKFQKGAILPALLIISGAFIIIIYALLFILTLQFQFAQRQTASERAIHISEAGINYYRWHLAHDPDDFQDGTGGPGPYQHDYLDPQGASIGKFSLEITPPSEGSSIVTIKSSGWVNEFPKVSRTITAQYGLPSFSKYSFLSNSSSWYGAGITINGQIHSNNGIRMDGTNLSLVTSAQETYNCGTETGCHPPETKPGVWGSGGDQGLWQFPVPAVDFDSISFDFAKMKQDAQDNGLYFNDSNKSGYHLLFLSDGTLQVYQVNSTSAIKGYSVPGEGLGQDGMGGCRNRNQIIADETLVGTYNQSDSPIIFFEDNVWVEGTVTTRLTVAAARFPIQSKFANIWIPNNITYSAYDGSNSLGLIAQNDIYFARDVPEDFQLDAILMAQQGRILRHGYFDWCGGTSGAIKDKLTINGSVISFFKSYWNFGSTPDSGFITREINYDANNLFNPPPYFPTTGEYEFISWKEE
ncbi:hypothetical protein IID22_00405 [Patescibacteria group bacterium]|nr:hypothetical protein [Patescibacteria group bacterium]